MSQHRTPEFSGEDARWEGYLRRSASAFPYPPTPDIASAVRGEAGQSSRLPVTRHRLVWAALAAAGLVVGILAAVPQVRADVLDALRIGSVRILLTEPPPELPGGPEVPVTAMPLPGDVQPPPTATPATPNSLNLAGETTLAEAQVQVGFPIVLPTYPPDLGPPDRVYVQDLGGPAVVLVWLNPKDPDRVRFSLHQLDAGAEVIKFGPPALLDTTVRGQPAFWTEGPYPLEFVTTNGETAEVARRLVSGHVLIWQEEGITYRLETDVPLSEALQMAESLR